MRAARWANLKRERVLRSAVRIAAVGDIHGKESLAPFRDALAAIEDPDLFLLAGDLTDHNNDHATYRQKFDLVFLDDEDRTFEIGGETIRVIGSTGVLDEPTWWQRNNLPGIEREYEVRVRKLDQLLAGEDRRLLLTHYPPTHATMGGEKEAWRTQLGSLRLEKVVLRRQPDLVVHGHVHKGIPFAELQGGQSTLESFGESRRRIPVYDVAFPVTRKVVTIAL